MTDNSKNIEDLKADGRESKRHYGGILWGLVLGSFVVGSYVMEMSHSEFQDCSKIGLVSALVAFVVMGALFGEKFMEKLGAWLQWF